jgi:UDP:flavonoid glycosyltransferase YjiC (YdhE family)
VRALFSFAGNHGHLDPLLPIARAVRAAGHSVAVTGRPLMVPAIEAAGFQAFATGTDAGGEPRRAPLARLDATHEELDFRDGFAGRMARERAPAVLELCQRWYPDVVVCDECDFGAMAAAERLGLPYATVVVLATGSFAPPALLAPRLHELRAWFGLPPDPDLTMLSRYLVLSPAPPSYRDPAYPLPATAHHLRPSVLDTAVPQEPAPDGRAIVYVTLGTVFNTESGDLFARVLAGLRDLPVDAVATVGHHIDPAELGPQPENVRVARYIPQAQVLPRCRAVVSHAGSGSVLAALAYGLPSVLLPMGADQAHNADRCARLGVARVLDAVDATPADIGEALSAVLAEPAYRAAAARLRAEALALPGAPYAAALLADLAATRRSWGNAGGNGRDRG